jgi:hypothetical protein
VEEEMSGDEWQYCSDDREACLPFNVCKPLFWRSRVDLRWWVMLSIGEEIER